MCGIWALLRSYCTEAEANRYLAALRNRGPEGSRLQTLPADASASASVNATSCMLGFTRLAINGLTESGMQPMNYYLHTPICTERV